MAEEANTAPVVVPEKPAAPKSPYERYADFISTEKQSSMFSGSSGPLSNDDIARATGKIDPKK